MVPYFSTFLKFWDYGPECVRVFAVAWRRYLCAICIVFVSTLAETITEEERGGERSGPTNAPRKRGSSERASQPRTDEEVGS